MSSALYGWKKTLVTRFLVTKMTRYQLKSYLLLVIRYKNLSLLVVKLFITVAQITYYLLQSSLCICKNHCLLVARITFYSLQNIIFCRCKSHLLLVFLVLNFDGVLNPLSLYHIKQNTITMRWNCFSKASYLHKLRSGTL